MVSRLCTTNSWVARAPRKERECVYINDNVHENIERMGAGCIGVNNRTPMRLKSAGAPEPSMNTT